jgi:hypothetical protein
MEVDEPHQAPREQKRRCFCCGRKYGTRQLARHLRHFLARLDQEIAAGQVVADEEDLGDDDAGSDDAKIIIDDAGPDDAAMDIDHAEEAGNWDEDRNQGKYMFSCDSRMLIIL